MGKRVLFLDDDEDLRDIVVQVLEGLDVTCDAVGTVEEMKAAVERSNVPIDVAILDINLGRDRESGLDAYRWLRRRGFEGRIAFLTGHGRNHPLVADALRAGDATVHDKPISVVAFRHMLT